MFWNLKINYAMPVLEYKLDMVFLLKKVFPEHYNHYGLLKWTYIVGQTGLKQQVWIQISVYTQSAYFGHTSNFRIKASIGWMVNLSDFYNKCWFSERFHEVPLTHYTVMILSFRRVGLGKQCRHRSDCSSEQSDQGLHCLQFPLHFLGTLLYGKTTLFKL